ncbi:hypothetical protein ACQ4LE_009221 [Meloidogyne hapla]
MMGGSQRRIRRVRLVGWVSTSFGRGRWSGDNVLDVSGEVDVTVIMLDMFGMEDASATSFWTCSTLLMGLRHHPGGVQHGRSVGNFVLNVFDGMLNVVDTFSTWLSA